MGICDECIIKDGCKFANSGLIMKHCKNFIGEAPREIKTNFQRITSSPEALASWLDEHAEFCAEIPCDECSVNKECWHQGCDVDFSSNAKRWISWLKQENK